MSMNEKEIIFQVNACINLFLKEEMNELCDSEINQLLHSLHG